MPLSLSFASGPIPTLAVLDCEQTNKRPQSTTCDTFPKQTSCFLPLCFTTNVTLFSLARPFGSINHLQPIPAPPAFFSFLCPFCQCFIKHYHPLHSITIPTYLSISAPFLPPSSDPFATRRSKVGQVNIASPAPKIYPTCSCTYPDFLTRRKTLAIFDNLLLLCDVKLYPTL